MATNRLTGHEAIRRAERDGVTLSKHSDPSDEPDADACDGISVERAREIASEDPALIYLDVQQATLAELDPTDVADDALEMVLSRLARLHVPLGPGVTLTVDGGAERGPGGKVARRPPDPRATDLHATVAQLTRWAQSGDLGDWSDHEGAADALQTAASVLCSAPIRPWRVDDLDAAVDLDRDARPWPLALVLACALSRLRVCRGEPVTLAELARLASVSAVYVRKLAGSGEIASELEVRGRARTGVVEAAEARRWLASRGLAGW